MAENILAVLQLQKYELTGFFKLVLGEKSVQKLSGRIDSKSFFG
jgi:hypothetical protein